MLPKSRRLPGRNWAQRGKLLAKSAELALFARANGKTGDRVGVAVSSKVSKSAVERNLFRRRIYAALGFLPMNHGRDIIISVLPPVRELKFKELQAELKKMWAKL